MEKPSFGEFIKSAGAAGASSVVASVVLFAITVKEHIEHHDVSTVVFFALACLTFCYGAYCSWSNERVKHLHLDSLFKVAEIKGEILRASIDTKVYEDAAWRSIEDGVCLTILVEAVNHSQAHAWNRTPPTLDISFGAKSYSGTSIELPQSQYLLEFNDPTLKIKQMTGLSMGIWVNGSDWVPAMPRQGYLCFVVPGVDHNIMKLERITASMILHIHDTLGKDHQIPVKGISVSKGLVRMYTPPQQLP